MVGQQDIYDFLKQNNSKWYTAKQICSLLQGSIGSITRCLGCMRRANDVDYKIIKDRNITFTYRWNRKA